MTLRKVLLRAVAAFTGLFLVAAAFVIYDARGTLGNPFDDRTFDRSEWLAHRGDDDRDNPRGMMFEDLVNRLERNRPRRAEVLDLLGSPDYNDMSGREQPDQNLADRLSYNLGMWSGFRIDYDSLEIEFDENDRVKEAYRIQH